MAYDEGLAERIRAIITSTHPIAEKRMFGGLAFMHVGYMSCGVIGDTLMARVGPERYQEALAKPGARPMDFTGKPMNGYVFVSPDAITDDDVLEEWVTETLRFVETLPAR